MVESGNPYTTTAPVMIRAELVSVLILQFVLPPLVRTRLMTSRGSPPPSLVRSLLPLSLTWQLLTLRMLF